MSAPLRLAVLNQREGGGATAHARDLLAQAAARGWATSYHPDGGDGDPAALLARLDAFRPDVVHAHCFYNTWPPETLRAVAARWPVAFTLHDVYAVNQYGTECWECYRNPWCYACPALPFPKRLYSVYRVRSRRARERAWTGLDAHVICPTLWMQRRMRRTAVSRLSGSHIRYGIDTRIFRRDARARQTLNLPHAVPLIVSVGSMYSADDDRKGFAFLLDAFTRRVRPVFPDARLAIIGRTFGLEARDGVTYLSDVANAELRSWYSAATAFVLASLGDNAPLAILEAMACEAAVVATRVGGIPEEVDDGVTGVLVPPRDAAALGDGILRVLQLDAAVLTAMGQAGRRRVLSDFEREKSFAAHAELFQRLAAERRPVRR